MVAFSGGYFRFSAHKKRDIYRKNLMVGGPVFSPSFAHVIEKMQQDFPLSNLSSAFTTDRNIILRFRLRTKKYDAGRNILSFFHLMMIFFFYIDTGSTKIETGVGFLRDNRILVVATASVAPHVPLIFIL